MGLKRPTIEVPLVLTSFAFELLGPVTTNLMIYRTCYIILGYNQTECAMLGNSVDNNITKNLEKTVQPVYNVIDTTKSMIEQVIGLTLCLIAGQCSDKFGRRPLILISQTGMVLSLLVMTILSYFPYISPWFFMLSSIPSMLTGGFATFFVTLLSYTSDISTDETRGMRMAILEACFAIGMLVGNLSSSYLFYATNYASMYAIAAGFMTLSILYTYFFLPESLKNINRQFQLKEVFKVADIKDMFQVLIKKRDSYNRSIILIITAILTIFVFIGNGDSKLYLLLRDKFGWTYTHYTIYSSISNLSFGIGSIGGTYILQNLLRVTESVIILLGLISGLNGSLVRGLATNDLHIYFSLFVRLLGGVISPQCRTLVAKLVPTGEIAKIFSLIMIIQFVVSIAASPVYTMIYNMTVNTDSAIYNFVSAGFFGVNISLILAIMVLELKVPPVYVELVNEEPINTPAQVIETF